MRRLITAGVAAVAVTGIAFTAAGPSSADPAPKITICHGTASETNPYVEITVSANSFKDGHFDDFVDKSHGVNNHPDFVLTPGRTCDDGPTGSTTTTSTTEPPTTPTTGGSTTTTEITPPTEPSTTTTTIQL
jgi:hypothetical protein